MSVAIVLILAFSIAANAITFDVLDRLLLSGPPGITQPSSIVRLYKQLPSQRQRSPTTDVVSFPALMLIRQNGQSFASISAYATATVALATRDGTQPIQVQLVTGNFLSTLGIAPVIGRAFSEDDDRAAFGAPGVIISFNAWQQWFGGSTSALGSVLLLNNQPLTIIGVAPRYFRGLEYGAVSCWVPLQALAPTIAGKNWDVDPGLRWLHVIARLRAGTLGSVAAAQTSTRLYGNHDPATLSGAPRLLAGSLIRARDPVSHSRGNIAAWLASVSAILLVIACANVASLLLVRAMMRRQQLALQMALGLSKYRLYRQFIMESVVLTGFAGCIAIVLIMLGSVATRRYLLPEIVFSQPILRTSVIGFTTIVSLSVAFITGLFPALWATEHGHFALLRGAQRSPHIGGFSGLSLLLAVQVGLTCLLLFAGVLFVRSLQHARSLNLGFNPSHVWVARPLRRVGTADSQLTPALYSAVERIARLPNVGHAALATTIPFTSNANAHISEPGQDSLDQIPGSAADVNSVSSDYFEAIGTQVRSGSIDRHWDLGAAGTVAAVNEEAATDLWPSERAVGKCLVIAGASSSCREIVAVVSDMRVNDFRSGPKPQVFVPFGELRGDLGSPVLFVRVRSSSSVIPDILRRQLSSVWPSGYYVDIQPLDAYITPQQQSWRLGSAVLSLLALLSCLIAGLGVVATVSYVVRTRQREFCTRIALGASATSIAFLVLRYASTAICLGTLVGFAVAWLVGPRLDPLLFGIKAHDAMSFVVVCCALAVTALPACLVPALNASRTDPSDVLRTE